MADPQGIAAAAALAAWLGLLTAISPCPLASNLAALAFIARQSRGFAHTALAGLAFALGRAMATVLLAALLVKGLLAVPGLSFKLEQWGGMVTGPALVVMGLLMLDLVPVRLPGLNNQGLEDRLAKAGGFGASLALGGLLALAFCPVSAGLFFGNLLPLATAHQSPWLLPAVYGLATAVPVAALGVAVGAGAGAAARVFNAVARVETWLRRATAAVFVAAGAYLCVKAFFPQWLG